MMKLIADSSANLTMLEGVTYQSVPMTIRAGERDFVDDETLDTHELLDYLAAHNGKSGTACPSLDGWLKAFEGADEIFVITITSSLSGTCASAMAARDVYLQSAKRHRNILPPRTSSSVLSPCTIWRKTAASAKSPRAPSAFSAFTSSPPQVLRARSSPLKNAAAKKRRARRWYRNFWKLTTTAARCAFTTPKIQRRLGRSPLRCTGTFLKQTLRSVPAVVFAATMPSAAA